MEINYTIRIGIRSFNLAGKVLNIISDNDLDLLLGDGWDMVEKKDEEGVYYELIGHGWQKGSYDPGCYRTSNGDGWPASFDVEDGNFDECDLDSFICKIEDYFSYLEIMYSKVEEQEV